MSDYPRDRRGVWVLDFLKVLNRAEVAMELGPHALGLILAVAMGEHARDYMSPPNFWNGQLKNACGLSDDDAFAALRSRCVRAGWLSYQRGACPRTAGRYWVQVPPGLSRLLDRIPVKPVLDPGTNPVTKAGTNPGTNPGTKAGINPGTSPGTNPGTDPGSSSPYPNPSLPHPPPPPKDPAAGGGVGVGDPWESRKDKRARVEAMLDALQVATGPKATSRWMEALKACKRVRTMQDAEACLREVIGRQRADGQVVNYASEVADRIRRWKPTPTAEAQP